MELATTLREAKRAYMRDNLVEAMGQYEYARAIYGAEAELEVGGETLADVLNMILACAQPLAQADARTMYGGGEKGYTDYPTLDGKQAAE